MISIKCVGGPHDNVVRIPPADVKPASILFSMVDSGWGWEIDYSHAIRDETIAWGGADMLARAYRAVKTGRSVNFLGTEYSSIGELQTLEDALVGSGYDVQIARDDESGVEIAIIQPE
jgi:hypothetical protein